MLASRPLIIPSRLLVAADNLLECPFFRAGRFPHIWPRAPSSHRTPQARCKLAEESGSLDVRRMAASTAIWTQPNLKTAQSERPRRMSKIVEGVFVPRLNSLNERLWNDPLWRKADTQLNDEVSEVP
jgi:hypothetical protein